MSPEAAANERAPKEEELAIGVRDVEERATPSSDLNHFPFVIAKDRDFDHAADSWLLRGV